MSAHRIGLDLATQITHAQIFRIIPCSIHGMLWLQTHFASEHWEPLAEGRVAFAQDDLEKLLIDAKKAGLRIDATTVVS